MNPDALKLYESNNLTITRQVHYSTKHEKSVDVVLSLNGIPIITIELKNPMTGQTWQNAVHQYRHDRDQNEFLFSFKKRALVHFAVDTDEIYMTTKLLGESTEFLPFNKGNNNGAGNPENPSGYKTCLPVGGSPNQGEPHGYPGSIPPPSSYREEDRGQDNQERGDDLPPIPSA